MEKIAVTICRQFCSGGLEVGKKLAERLDADFYDKEQLVSMAAKEIGYAESSFERVDETATNSFLYSLVMGVNGSSHSNVVPDNDRLFNIQSEIIRKAAAENSCVIMGRCSDYVLRNEKRLVKVFIRSDNDWRVERHKALYGDAKDIPSILQKRDKKRASYYKFYTGRTWDCLVNYDLCINTAKVGIDNAVNMIIDYIEKMN